MGRRAPGQGREWASAGGAVSCIVSPGQNDERNVSADSPFSPAARRQAALEFVRRFHSAHGYGPSIGEVAAAICSVRSVALYHVASLEEAGLVQRDYTPGGIALARSLRPARGPAS